MDRRELLLTSTALGLAPLAAAAGLPVASSATTSSAGLPVPASGSIPVAFLITDGAVVIDFAGPWEVFESVSVVGRHDPAFNLYTVGESTAPVKASGGLTIVPEYTFKNAPQPKILVIPAQHGAGDAALEWIRAVSANTDVTMSVCTGAKVLARTGLLDGKSATTHHGAYADFAMEFPKVTLIRGARFVEAGNLASSGGLSSGIDLSLRVVERYFGRTVAQETTYYLEYQGQGWTDPNSNQIYRTHRASTAAHPFCAVCDMAVDPASSPRSVYRGTTYFFCMESHKALFDKSPGSFVDAAAS